MARPFRPFARGPRRSSPTAADDTPSPDAAAQDESELDDLFAALSGADEASVDDGAESTSLSPAPAAPADSAAPEPAIPDLVSPALREAYGLARAPKLSLEARPYQREALAAWAAQRGRGVVVLPTGAGKTVVALIAAARLGLRTLVVAPTIELLHQWRSGLADGLGVPLDDVGIVGGGKRTVRDLTVITYDSAAMPHRRLDGFGLLVVDEVHHLPARAYRSIAGKVNAPFRLGLSATPERSDDGHEALPDLVGPIVYRKSAAELARDEHIASYSEKRLFVDLSAEEQLRYDQLMAEYKWYIATTAPPWAGRRASSSS